MWSLTQKSEERFAKLWTPGLILLISILFYGCDKKNENTVTVQSQPIKSPEQLHSLIQNWDKEHWTLEKKAQSLNQFIDLIWGRLRSKISSPLGSNQIFNLEYVDIPKFVTSKLESTDWIAVSPTSEKIRLPLEEFTTFLKKYESRKWSLEWSEWRLTEFNKAEGVNETYEATIQCRLHLKCGDQESEPKLIRLSINGELETRWLWDEDQSAWFCQSIDASKLNGVASTTPPLFSETFRKKVPAVKTTGFIDPLIIQDLNNDGSTDVILGTRNLAYLNSPDSPGIFKPQSLHTFYDEVFKNALIIDMNSDGNPDYVGLKPDGVYLIEGKNDFQFGDELQQIWKSPTPLLNPLAMTAGDADGDRDLDLWIGQYKIPFNRGQMPTPFYDANDGFPSFFLENIDNGKLRIKNIKEVRSLSNRRNYSASLADIDLNGTLDLITFNDFAGVDIFINKGQWKFSNQTEDILDVRHLFAMGHCISDWNNDGLADIFAVGMKSPIASRVEKAGSVPSKDKAFFEKLGEVNFGNRLYLSKEKEAPLNSSQPLGLSIADSGWAWGITNPDINRDGFADFYITTGHVSRGSSVDYDNRFWTRDLFLGNSDHNEVLNDFFRSEAREVVQRGESYGGYFANRFYQNIQGRDSIEIAWLLGLELPNDCRNVSWTDIDNDGDQDLILLSMNVWPETYQAIHIFENSSERVEQKGTGWIGLDIRYASGGSIPYGLAVVIECDDQKILRYISSWESYRVQPDSIIRLALPPQTEDVKIRFTTTQNKELEFTDLELNAINTILIP